MGDPTQGPSGPSAGTTAPPATTAADDRPDDTADQLVVAGGVTAILIVAFVAWVVVMERLDARRQRRADQERHDRRWGQR